MYKCQVGSYALLPPMASSLSLFAIIPQIPSWLMCFLPKNKKEEDISTQKSNESKSNPTPIHVLPTFIKNKNILVMQMDMP